MRRLRRFALALAAGGLSASALAAPGLGEPGKISVGLAPGTSPEEAVHAVEAATGGEVTVKLDPLDALVVSVPDVGAAVEAADALPGVEYAESAGPRRRLYFEPNDPLYTTRQWYLPFIRAFDYWVEPPPLPPVLVSVVDFGIDGAHPEFQGRIEAARSFVSSPARIDRFGHGTMVAGEIAAALNNAQGIAGAGLSARILVAKVTEVDGAISIEAEARAIRWAVDRGARVVNLSLGGPRNPRDRARDTYSALEHAAVNYATRKGATVVAAAGNCEFVCPYPYASWPAALPHVLGVSALARDGSTPAFSNRDRIYNDLAAPGKGIVSTFPLRLAQAGCTEAGYSSCAREPEYRRGEGTSFASPLAAAAAAVVLGSQPALAPSQVTSILETAAADLHIAGHDRRSGWGRLDVEGAVRSLGGDLPPADRLEPNDDAGARAARLRGLRRTVDATLHRYDDFMDVYRLYLRRGERAYFTLDGPLGARTSLILWERRTRRIADARLRLRADVLARSARPGPRERIGYRARRAGSYYLEARVRAGLGGPYRLTVRRTR